MTTPRTLHDTHCTDLHCKYMQNSHKYIQIHKHTNIYTHSNTKHKKLSCHTHYPLFWTVECCGACISWCRKKPHTHGFFGEKYFTYDRKCFQYRFGLSKGYMMPFSKEPVIAWGYTLVPYLSFATEPLYLYPILGKLSKLLSDFFQLRGPQPPTPLAENHFSKNPLAETGLTESLLSFSGKQFS